MWGEQLRVCWWTEQGSHTASSQGHLESLQETGVSGPALREDAANLGGAGEGPLRAQTRVLGWGGKVGWVAGGTGGPPTL